VHVSEIITPIDKGAAEKWEAIYIEILAKEGRRAKPAVSEIVSEDVEDAKTAEES
jgi:hypothetical protein